MMPDEVSTAKRVLVVDDDPGTRQIIVSLLSQHRYAVTAAESAAEALRLLEEALPDIILTDVCMPEVSGIELVERIRQMQKLHHVPVILISALGDTRSIVAGLKAGANDYVTKPFDCEVLAARVETQLTAAGTLAQLEEQASEASRLASFDPLTSVYNRRALEQILIDEVSRSGRHGHCLCVLMMDLDHFKNINDTHGHAAGDEVLVEFAHRVVSVLRAEDVLARYGGEEFVAILPETSIASAAKTAERICRHVALTPIRISANPTRLTHLSVTDRFVRLTVSVGVAAFDPRRHRGPHEALEEADKALYQAKQAGRNCVRVCA